MKKKLLVVFLLLSFIASAQEAYYNDVDVTAEGIALKENLATKTINAHTKLLLSLMECGMRFRLTDLNPTNQR